MDKTTAGQKGSGGLQDMELKRRVGGIYGGGGGGGREKEREGKEDDDRLKHFGRFGFDLLIGRIGGKFALRMETPAVIFSAQPPHAHPGHNQSCSS